MTFSSEQRITLQTAMDRIVPEDDFPSASQNGVAEYIERWVADDSTGSFAENYRYGLASLDAEAAALFGLPFATLTFEQQDTILAAVESGVTTADWPVRPTEFFQMLLDHVVEGYYTDPEHNGSNPGKLSWRMIGFVERSGFEQEAASGE